MTEAAIRAATRTASFATTCNERRIDGYKWFEVVCGEIGFGGGCICVGRAYVSDESCQVSYGLLGETGKKGGGMGGTCIS